MAMSTQAKGLLLFLAVVSYASGARGFTTHISNGASRAILATTSYDGQSQFIGRTINPGASDKDEYSTDGVITVELWVTGAPQDQHRKIRIAHDRSLVGYNHAAGSTGVDIYLAKYGTLFQQEGNVLTTIFLFQELNSRHNSTGPRELS